VSREIVQRFSALQAEALEAVVRPRADLKAHLTALFSEVKNESASLRRDPSWKPYFFEKMLLSGFDIFKPQLCSRFLTTDTAKDAKDQLAELKQIKSAKTYSSIFRTAALSVTDLYPHESLDRNLPGLKIHVRAQVLLQKSANLKDSMRLAEIYDP
jgi:hypothetical protein